MVGVKGRRVETDEGTGTVVWSKQTVLLVKLDSGSERMFHVGDVTFC